MDRDNDRWVAEIKAEDTSALSDLRSALVRNLHGALRGRSGVDESFYEDVAQDSVVRILSCIDQFNGRSRFLTWSTTIAIRVALSELRRSHWRDVSLSDLVPSGEAASAFAVDTEPTPDVQMERNGIVDAMLQIIEFELTDRQRTALLAELRGMPQEEIARQLGSNRNALYKLTHDARKSLRAGLEAAGYSADEVVAMTSH